MNPLDIMPLKHWVAYGLASVLIIAASQIDWFDVDDDKLRPSVRFIKQHYWVRVFVMGSLVAIEAIVLVTAYDTFIQRFSIHPAVGVFSIGLAIIGLGIGPIVGIWLTTGEVVGVEQP